MYKNQLQELAQRSCFNLPSYACIREGPDHAPRFKATVNFNGEVFESPAFCTTLRQAEHAAAEVALNALFRRGLSRTLAVKVLDETGVYKNLLQETAHRAGLKLPVYTTVRSGPGHTPIFSCTVELGGMSFSGEPAKTKKQAQKNAAMAAWSALKQLPHSGSSFSSSSSPSEHEPNDEQEQVIVACALASLHQSEANKQSTQTSDRQHNNHRRPAVVRRDMNPTSDYSYYPRPCHSWTYPSFNSDATMYHMWQQSQASQQQSHLLTLPAPPHPADPRFLPLLRSMIQPAQGQFYSGIGQDCISPMPCFPQSTIPVLPTYFSDYSSSPTARSRSQVTIQEINEEKNQLEEKDWLCGGTPDAAAAKPTTPRTSNLQPDASLASEVSSDRETDIALTGFNPVPSGSDTSMANESSVSTKIQEKQMDRSPRMPFKCHTQNPHPSGPGVNHPPSAGSARPRGFRPPHNMSVPLRSGFRAEGLKPRSPSMAAPVTIRTAIPVCSARPSTANYMAPHNMSVPMKSGFRAEGLRPRSSSMAAPVTIRTAIPVCSARPSTVNYMAPAVHVRTIVPVCSAPPVRAPDSTQRKSSQDAEGSRGG